MSHYRCHCHNGFLGGWMPIQIKRLKLLQPNHVVHSSSLVFRKSRVFFKSLWVRWSYPFRLRHWFVVQPGMEILLPNQFGQYCCDGRIMVPGWTLFLTGFRHLENNLEIKSKNKGINHKIQIKKLVNNNFNKNEFSQNIIYPVFSLQSNRFVGGFNGYGKNFGSKVTMHILKQGYAGNFRMMACWTNHAHDDNNEHVLPCGFAWSIVRTTIEPQEKKSLKRKRRKTENLKKVLDKHIWGQWYMGLSVIMRTTLSIWCHYFYKRFWMFKPFSTNLSNKLNNPDRNWGKEKAPAPKLVLGEATPDKK